MLKRMFGLVALLTLIGSVQAQEYKLKFKSYPADGETYLVKESDKSTSTTKIEVNGTNLPDEVKKSLKELEYSLKVTKSGDGKPAEFKRTYTKATTNDGETTKKLPYDGRTIVFALKGDTYKVSAEGEPELDEKKLADLSSQGKDPLDSLDQLLDPGKAVKVGDSWNSDKKKLGEMFAKEKLAVDADKVKGTVKLVKVYQKDKQQWGTLDLKLEIPIKALSGPGAALKFTEPAVLNFNLVIDRPIDGSSAAMTGKGTMAMNFKGTLEQGGMTINVESKVEGTTDRSMEKK